MTSDILAFDLGGRRGFQLSEKNVNTKSLFLFDSNYSGLEFRFSHVGANHNRAISQAEINAVLLSIRPASSPSEPSKSPPKKKG